MYENTIEYTSDISLAKAQNQRHITQEKCKEICSRSRRQIIFSNDTALKLQGADLPESLFAPSTLEHAAVPKRVLRSDLKGVKFHLWTPQVKIHLLSGGLFCVTPAIAWLQMGRLLSLDSLIILGDSLMRSDRRLRLTSLANLSLELKRTSAFLGKDKCQQALLLMRENTDSPMETIVRLLLERYGIPRAEINYEIRDGKGHFIRVDLAWPEQFFCIEYDGKQHFETVQHTRDLNKGEQMMHSKWRVLRIGINQVSTAQAREHLCETVAISLGLQ